MITMIGGAMLVEGVCLTVALQHDLARCGDPDRPGWVTGSWIDDFQYREYMGRIGVPVAPAHERLAAGEAPTWRFVVEHVGSTLSVGEIARVRETVERVLPC